jgi:hypothetical protein
MIPLSPLTEESTAAPPRLTDDTFERLQDVVGDCGRHGEQSGPRPGGGGGDRLGNASITTDDHHCRPDSGDGPGSCELQGEVGSERFGGVGEHDGGHDRGSDRPRDRDRRVDRIEPIPGQEQSRNETGAADQAPDGTSGEITEEPADGEGGRHQEE